MAWKRKISSKLEQKIPLCLGPNPLEAYSDKEASTGIAGSQTKHWERPGKQKISGTLKEHPKQPLRELEKVVKRMSKNPPQDIRDVPCHRRDGLAAKIQTAREQKRPEEISTFVRSACICSGSHQYSPFGAHDPPQ